MCLVVAAGLFLPRLVLFLTWLFTDYLARAYDTFLWPFLGFFFAPTTTLAYAIAENSMNGLKGGGLVLVLLGIVIDAGLIGGGRGLKPWERYQRSRARRAFR
jgi:hypothetical protein